MFLVSWGWIFFSIFLLRILFFQPFSPVKQLLLPLFRIHILTCLLFSPTGQGNIQPGVDPTDCQIFTLTPPPITRHPVTRFPPFIRTPKCPIHRIPQRRPGIYIPYPNKPPPTCKHHFQFHPVWRPQNFFPNYRYILRRQLQKGSSSESREKIKIPNRLKQKKRMLQKRLK